VTTVEDRCLCGRRGWSSAEFVHRLVTPRDRLAADVWPQRRAFPADMIESRSVASSAPRRRGGTSDGTPSNVDVVEVPSVNAALAH